MRGTAISAVARSRLIVRMISDGFVESSNTVVAPSSGGTNSAITCPKTWLSGTSETNRSGCIHFSYLRYGSMPRSSGSRLARKFPCVKTTPRGSAVVPDVNKISAIWFRVTGSSASRVKSATRAPGTKGTPRVISSKTTAAELAVPLRISGFPLAAKTNFAFVSRATRDANSIVAPSSSGTATAPRSKHPQNAATHSNEFGPHKITRSPVCTPRSRSKTAQLTAQSISCAYVQLSRRYPRRCTTAASRAYAANSANSEFRLALAISIRATSHARRHARHVRPQKILEFYAASLRDIVENATEGTLGTPATQSSVTTYTSAASNEKSEVEKRSSQIQ